jgi:hypothetical protein
VFGRREDVVRLRAELDDVRALIAAHPLTSDRVRAAHQVIADSRTGGVDDVAKALADSGLPSAVELGRTQVAGFWSWWRLHRRKRRLEWRILRAAPPIDPRDDAT